jgi:hypothetical protein
MPLANISIEKQLHYAEKGEQGGVDIRNPSTALLGISSIDRYRDGISTSQYTPQSLTANTLSSPYDFNLTTRNQNLMTGFFTRLAVNEVQFRWTLPTLTARNNKIYINVAPNGNTAVTNVAHSVATTTFTLASTTGYSAGQTIVASGFQDVAFGGGSFIPINGVYTIASTTATTLVCNDPNGLPDFVTTALTGNVIARGLVTLPTGFYDIYNSDQTSDDRAGNMSYQLQQAVRGITSISALVNAFVVTYNLPYSGLDNSIPDFVPEAGQPYNCFFASNLASTGGLTTFYWTRYIEPTRPNAVSLFDMMAWNNFQSLRTYQYSSPNVCFLSTPFVDIVCDQLTNNQSLKDSDSGDISRTMLCRLWLTPDAFTGNVANLGSAPILVHRAFPFPKQIKWNADQPIGNLKFSVYDSQGYILTTFEGTSGVGTNPPTYYDCDMGDWTMTLLVSEV